MFTVSSSDEIFGYDRLNSLQLVGYELWLLSEHNVSGMDSVQ